VYAAEQQAPSPVSVHFRLAEKPSLRIDCSASLACTRFPAPAASYAYAPADIDYQGVDHLFFCSAGDPSAGFDEIRYINDRDKKMAIVLSVPGYRDAGGKDMAAC